MKNLFKALLTVGIFVIIFTKIDLSSILTIFHNANFIYLASIFPFIILIYYVKAKKWNYLLESINKKNDVTKNFYAILISLFYCLVTPGRVGELTRALYIRGNKAETVSTVIMDKIIDVYMLIILSDILVLVLFKNILVQSIMAIISLGFLMFILLVFNKRVMTSVFNWIIKKENLKEYMGGIRMMLTKRTLLAKNIAYTLIYYLLNMIVTFIVLNAFGATNAILLSLCFPIIVLLGNVPLTISGIGLREYVTMICFETLNADPNLGFTVSLTLFTLLTLFPGLFGGALSFYAKLK